MRRLALVAVAVLWSTGPLSAQAVRGDPVEIPVRVEEGRIVVTALGPGGAEYDFVLGLGMPQLTESGAARVGESLSSLTIGGLPVDTEQAQTVPDAVVPVEGAVGVLGGMTLNGYDLLIDLPNDRLLLKPVGRAVRWDGVSLSSPVSLGVFHDVLLRADVEIAGKVVGGLLDLAQPGLEFNEPLRSALDEGEVSSFRMGYGRWSSLPGRVVESPIFQGWDPQGNGFVVIGAAIAYDCAIAISWRHAELRTCLR